MEVIFTLLGTPFDFRLGYGQRLNPKAKVIQIDLDYGELGHNRDVDLGICGDASAILTQLTDALGTKGSQSEAWLRLLREAQGVPTRNEEIPDDATTGWCDHGVAVRLGNPGCDR